MTAEPTTGARARFGQELARLRGLAGMTLREVSAATGHRAGEQTKGPDTVPHARLARAEAGTATLSSGQLEAVLAALGVDEPTRERMQLALDGVHTETVRWRSHLRRHGHAQDLAAQRERQAMLVRTFAVDVVPGLLQTEAYARAVFHRTGQPDPEKALAARLARQELLHETGRRFEFVLMSRLLGWNPDPSTVSMSGQHDRLLQVTQAAAAEVRVVDDLAPVLHPGVGFVLYEEQVSATPMVTMDLMHGGPIVDDPDDVAQYRAAFVELFATARPLEQVLSP